MRCSLLFEKSPPNIIRMPYLQACFPSASFLVVMRHSVPVAFATKKWSNTSISSLIKHWLTAHDVAEQYITRIQKVMFVCYEELITDSRTTLERVFPFMGLDPIIPCGSSDIIDPGTSERYFQRWHSSRMSIVRACCRTRYAISVARFGYSL